MVSRGGNSLLAKHGRPQLHLGGRNEVEEAMELLAYGYKGDQFRNSQRPQVVMQPRPDDDLALALALSQSLMMSTPSLQPDTIAEPKSLRNEEMAERDVEASNPIVPCSDEPSCANDFAIAMALSAIDGASSCIADLESIQLEDTEDNASRTRYDAGMILVGDEGEDEDDEWSCVIQGDLQEILGSNPDVSGAEATWSIVSSDQEYIIPQEQQKQSLLPTYKEVLECCFVDRENKEERPMLHNNRPNIQASKTFVRPLHNQDDDPDSSLRPYEDDPFADWDHFKNGHGGKESLRFKGNQRADDSPWWKPRGGWSRAEEFIRFNK